MNTDFNLKAAFIVSGGIGDVLFGLSSAKLYNDKYNHSVDIYVNSHEEITEFVNKCTNFTAIQCPERTNLFKDTENPLNLPKEFLDTLFKKYDKVYSCFPDGLGQQPFAFPWFEYVKSYKEFMRTKINIRTKGLFTHDCINASTKNIFISPVSVTIEKNYPMPLLQDLINRLNQTKYNVIVGRTSNWKGTPIPFFLQGKFYDLVNRPIDEVVNVISRCDYFVGIDSGLAHVAYHLGLPRIVLQQQFNVPFHVVRYHQDCCDDMPLNVAPEHVFNRITLNIRDPITQVLPAQMAIPYNTNTKQLLYKKYYD